MKFDEYYKQEIEPLVSRFEEYRKNLLFSHRLNKMIILLSSITYAIWVYSYFKFLLIDIYSNFTYFHFKGHNPYHLLLPISFAFVVFLVWLINRNKRIITQFQFDAKELLYKKIIAFYPNLEYVPDNAIDISIIANSYLFPTFNNFENKNYVAGVYKNVSLQLSEVNLEYVKVQSEYINGRWENRTYVDKIFKGIFCIANLKKNFSATTYVIPDRFLKFFNNLPENLFRVKLEDPNFEKIFDVYSEDQVEARFILTPIFMERLVKLNEMQKLHCFFQNGQIFMALEAKEDFFPDLALNKKIDYERIKLVLKNIKIFFEIIDILKLEIV